MESQTQKQNSDTTPKEKKQISGRNINLIMSIVMAIVLWMYVLVEVNPETTLPEKEVPVQLLNVESLKNNRLSLMDDQAYTVKVKIKGKRSDVANVTADQIIVTADLANVKKGDNYIPVGIDKLPEGVSIEQISPANLTVRVEKIIQATKNVQIQYKGTGLAGMEAEVISLEPSKIMLEGAESDIAKVSKVTATVSVDKISDGQSMELTVLPVDENGEFIKDIVMEKDVVRAEIALLPVKEVPFEVVIADGGTEDTSILVNEQPGTIRIKAQQDILNTIDAIASRPIDPNLLTESKELPVTPNLPEGVYVSRSNPPMTASFIVEELLSKTFDYEAGDIKVVGLAEDLQCEITDLQITVEVKGNQETIENINKNAIELTLDVQGLSEGEEYTSKLTYSVIKSVIVSIEPEQVVFKISKQM